MGDFRPQGGIPNPVPTPPPSQASSPVLFPTYPFDSPKALTLRQEVETMISKGALGRVPDPGPGFYSRLFLVEKASGGWRPVIDLSPFNELIQQTPFKMETASSVLLVRRGDFLASIDLNDAYLRIPVHTSSRKWLRFVSDGTVHQFKVLCFELSTAPQVFTRVFATVSAWADTWAIFEDAFRHPGDNLDTYAFPPFHLVERVVARVRETPNLSMTLVAPLWPEKAWFAELLPLLTQPPLALPL